MHREVKQIEILRKRALQADHQKVGRQLRAIVKKTNDQPPPKKVRQQLSRLKRQVKASVRLRALRRQQLPRPTYNADLPIIAKKDEIIATIQKHQVIIIAGETGSGKTTQIPKFCLEAGRGIDGKIGCTQPRRIAAITVANRIAEELNDTEGKAVGYKIRFQDQTHDQSYIKVMTDGILLSETQSDHFLNAYDTIIVDEAHERSLNIDFILGILKTLLPKRRDLKLIITSATIDTDKFSKAFNNAPIIEVSGRMFPVEVHYLEENQATPQNDEVTYIELAVKAVDRLLGNQGPFGDILMFMPTEQDIRETQELIEGRNFRDVTVLPIFARLSAKEQAKVFQTIPGRKIVIATNIAETSITIPGIKYVIDTGNARISRYSPRSRTTSLPISPISRSSADQRMGRCGRVENGICIRLYSKDDYLNRPLFTLPEILRANLAEVILRMIALKLDDIATFPFIDAPQTKNITDGINILLELGAIKPKKQPPRQKKSRSGNAVGYQLTPKGRLMARLPIDPRLTRILIESQTENCLDEVAVIVAALSIQDPRERPAEKAAEADRIHAQFKHPDSDFLTLLTIWKAFHEFRKSEKFLKRVRGFCKSHWLSFKRMREWLDVHAQIRSILEDYEFQQLNPTPPAKPQDKKVKSPQKPSPGFDVKYAGIHKSILCGYLSNIATKKEKNVFKASKGREVMIFPGSALFNQSQNWIVAAEMVETSRLFARTVANIDHRWLEKLGREHCKYNYCDPHWEKKRGEVVVSEQVSLFGLIIIPNRKVAFGKIDPEEATRIFIRSALIENDVSQSLDFLNYNQSLIQEVQNLEDKVRRRDILVTEDDLFAFYHDRIDNIFDIRTLKHYLKQKGTDQFLRLKRDDIVQCHPSNEELARFPNRVNLGHHQFKCSYRFDPGHEEDGLTVNIPGDQVGSVIASRLDWLVPGMLEEKIVLLLKGLPKQYRKQLVPIADTAHTIISDMQTEDRPLLSMLSEFIYNRFRVSIPADAWPNEALPDHLKTRIRITADNGKEICSSRSKRILSGSHAKKENLHQKRQNQFAVAEKKWALYGLTQWNFKDLPPSVVLEDRNKEEWYVYPGLSATDAQTVDLRLFWDPKAAEASHQKGVMRLYELHFAKDLKFLKKNLTVAARQIKNVTYFGTPKSFSESVYKAVIRDLFYKNIRTQSAFQAYAQQIGPEILHRGQKKLEIILSVVASYNEARDEISKLSIKYRTGSLAVFMETILKDLSNLIPNSFLDLYDDERMDRILRYVRALILRFQRASIDFNKDLTKSKALQPYLDGLKDMLADLSQDSSEEKRKAVEDFFWLIEEYKISLFAQELKTHIPISPKRLNKKMEEIHRMV